MTLRLVQKQGWDELRNEVKIYELSLPTFYKMKQLKGKRLKWSSGRKSDTYSYRSSSDNALILEVVGIWSNPKGTVKVIKVGDREHVGLFSRDDRPEGWTALSYDRYNSDKSDIFDNIDIGTFVVVASRYSGQGENEMEIRFISKEKTIDRVKTILDTLHAISKKRSANNHYRWRNEARVETYGTVSLREVLLQEKIFRRKLRFYKWDERKRKWDLANAMKAMATITKKNGKLLVKVKALDGNTYRLDAPLLPDKEESAGWRTRSVYDLEFWRDFCYREPNDSFLTLSKTEMTERLMGNYFLGIVDKLSKLPEIKLTFNRRSATITRKKTDKGANLAYIDGKLVKADSIREKLSKYFIHNIPIIPAKKGKTTIRHVMSADAMKLIEKGLNGVLRDLEGELPFHLNVIYKEKDRKWFLEIAGKEFYIRGGYNNLKKVKTAIEGTGIVRNRRKLGYDSRGTKVIRHRLAELVGDKNALWIILHVKKMGALYKAMGTSNQ